MGNEFRAGNSASRKVKMPMETASGRVVMAAVVAFLSAAVTILVTVLALSGILNIDANVNVFTFADAALLVVLGILLLTLKSRIAAIVLIAYFVLSKLMQYYYDPSTIVSTAWFTLFFVLSYVNGVVGTFQYQKLRKKAIAAQRTEEQTAREATQSEIQREIQREKPPQDPSW